MNDQNSQFQAILTAVGEAKQANADALGIPWTFAQMAVGDANGTDPFPDRLQTKLINERRRAPLNQLKTDPKNPGIIIAEQVIPENVGGFWIREIGLYDQDGDLVAVANCPGTFKPLLTQGSGRTQIIRMNLIVSSLGNIILKVDPSVVLATREYVDQSILTVLPDNKVAGTYRQVTIDKRGVVQSGSNPTTLAGFGITDALPNRNPLPGGSLDIHGDYYAFLTSPLESSVAQNCYWNGTAWYRHDISQPAVCITLDDGRCSVRRVGAGKNPITWQTMSPVWDASNAKFSGLLERPTTLSGYSIGDAFTKAETTANIEAAIARLIGSAPGAVDTIEELARALNNNPNFATDIINGLATKAAKATTLQGYGIGDAYTQSEINQLLIGKAAKATTLAGYGITNGLVDKNPLPGGSVDIHGDTYAFLTSPLESSVCQNCYWNGTAWYRHDAGQPAVSVTVSGGGALVRTAPAGAGPIVWASTEPLWTSKNATVTSSGGTGTLKLPNGWVQQIFEVTESTSASDVRYFPVSFPNECFGVFPVLLSSTSGGYGTNVGLVVGDVNKDRFLINAGGSFSGEGRFRVLALGR